MKSPLHILHLEDDPKDASLIKKTLAAGGFTCAITCVQNRDDYVAALEGGGIDLILSDGALPAFDGLSALEIAHTKWPAIPLIFVSGTMGDQRAIDSLKSGATSTKWPSASMIGCGSPARISAAFVVMSHPAPSPTRAACGRWRRARCGSRAPPPGWRRRTRSARSPVPQRVRAGRDPASRRPPRQSA